MNTNTVDMSGLYGHACKLLGLCVLFTVSETVFARSYPTSSDLLDTVIIRNARTTVMSQTSDVIPWPTLYGVHQTGSVNAAVSCFGTFGLPPFATTTLYDFWPEAGFESPPGSDLHYLFGGALWVGGIIGEDTLVARGTDGARQSEFYPTGYGGLSREGTVTPIDYPTLLSMRSEFDDTIHAGITYQRDYFGRSYQPLSIAGVHRSHSFSGYPAGECIIHDILVTNIGTQTIRQGYVGLCIDGDVYSEVADLFGYRDDLAGSIRNHGIAYIVDNDGDPAYGQYSATRSPTKVLAFKFLRSSFPALDTNFNWWVPNYYPTADFGPRQKQYPRTFGTGALGTPTDDRDQYYMLSTPEWDYDQVMTSTIFPDDPVWMLPDSARAYLLHRGGDTRFLMSIGPFELPPDSTISVQFAVFTADRVHTDPFIMDFVDIAPELYPLTLNLPAIVANAAVAESLGGVFDDSSLPPTGVHASPITEDTALVRWDPWEVISADSADIYLSPIPDSAFRHSGVIPVWYEPSDHTLYSRAPLSSGRHLLTSLTPGRAYACNVAFRSENQAGAVSTASLFRMPNPDCSIVMTDSVRFVTTGSELVITWSMAGNTAVDHFNIYRFSDSADARQTYSPFYSLLRLDLAPADSVDIDSQRYYYYAMPVYAQVAGDQFAFTDPASSDGDVYVVTAVDSSGAEYPFSRPVSVYHVPPRTKEICVLTNFGSRSNFVSGTNLKTFYNELLLGYDYDIFSYSDSMAINGGIYAEEIIDWHDFVAYQLLIIDDGMRDALLTSRLESRTGGFSRYLETGGTIAYFGSFMSIGDRVYDFTSDPAWYDISDKLVTDAFGIDSLFYVGCYYYRSHSVPPYVDSLFGFVRAQAVSGAPDIRFDSTRDIFSTDLSPYWPSNTAPSVSTFRPSSTGTVSHVYRSASPVTSVNEGQPVGVMTQLTQGQTYSFGFHLWYMMQTDARLLVDWIMNRVATESPEDPGQSLPTIRLAQNYPNPFNPATTIEYAVPSRSHVRLDIFNILGQQVRTIVDEQKSSGSHRAVWDGRDANGEPISTGIYLYRLQIGPSVLTRKMLLLK